MVVEISLATVATHSSYLTASLVQVDLMPLIRSGTTLWRITTINLPTLVSDLAVRITSVVETPFFFHSHPQVPQSDFCTIPATRLVEDCSQVTFDNVLCGLGLYCDLGIRASSENERGDCPLSTGEIHISKQQRHCDIPHSKQKSCHLHDRFAISPKPVPRSTMPGFR